MNQLKTTAIIAAAGSGRRLPGTVRKQFQPLSGKPVVAYSVEVFEQSPSIREIVLVVPEDSIDHYCKEIVEKFGFEKVTKIIPGGEERQHSVERGFKSISPDSDIVLVHDGVRPFVTARIVEEVIREAAKSGGAIVAIPVKDTIKKSSSENYIEKTILRESLWLAQTPQCFRYGVLGEAIEEAKSSGFIGTDEASLVERIGIDIKLVKGSEFNIKITTEEDLLLAELILQRKLHKERSDV